MTVFQKTRLRSTARLFARIFILSLVVIMPARALSISGDEIIDGDDPEGNNSGTQESPWNLQEALHVGFNDKGTLTIKNGGIVTTNTSDGSSISFLSNGEGRVIVSGTDSAGNASTWNNSGDLTVGVDSRGALIIENGGQVINAEGRIGNGVVTVTGTDANGRASVWKNEDDLKVASRDNGQGELRIDNGGKVTNNNGSIGDMGRSTGKVTVSGHASIWDNSGDLAVGRQGQGTLVIEDGGKVVSKDGFIGSIRRPLRSTGIVMVSGSDSAGNASTWENSGRLVVGHEDAGTLTIANDGVVSTADGVIIGNDEQATGVINIGAASLDSRDATGAGILLAENIEFGDGTGTLNFNHSDVDYEFSAHMVSAGSGVHSINHYAGTTVLTGDSAGFSGSTTVSGGTLSVGSTNSTGRLGGNVNVLDGGVLSVAGGSILSGHLAVGQGGTLTGSGTVGTTAITSGGTVAPGNSMGTLTVDGDLTFEAGSRYHVEVNPQGIQSDHIHVKGTATLGGGSVVHIGANGPYRPEASYRILTADTGLIGTFDDVSSNFAFLNPTLSYGLDSDSHTVELTLLRNSTSIASFARTPNQVATAQGLESLPQSSALLLQVLTLPDGTPAATFDALSGEVHASTASILHLGSTTARALPLSHLRTNLNAGMRPGALLAQAGSAPVPAAALPQSAALPLWAQVIGNWQRLDGNDNTGGLKQTTHGLFVGGDHAIGAGWRLGAALGYTDSRIRVLDLDSKADVNTYSATLYGGKAFELGTGTLNVLAGTAYSRHSIKTSRQAALGDWNHTLKADYHANTYQVFGELGYAVPMGRVTVEPFAGLAWSKLHSHSFSESGGPTALSGQSQRDDITTSTLGLRVSTDLDVGNTQGRVYASVGWRHAFGRVTPKSTLRFDGGQPFTVAGTPIARDSAVLELGADVAVSPNARIGLAYNGQLGNRSREHAGSVNVQWRF